MIRIHVDGSVKNQKGRAAVGILWIEAGKQVPYKFKLTQEMDNHEAEFWAVLTALMLVKKQHKTDEWVICYSDSRTVVDAVNRHYHPYKPYQRLANQVHNEMQALALFQLNWISEQENKGADQLAKQALNQK